MKIKTLNESKKENKEYGNGVFWVVADSIQDLLSNKYQIVSDIYFTNYYGKELSNTSKSSRTHKNVWDSKYKDVYNVDYTYYPRGRVSIYNGRCYININSIINKNQNIIADILDKFDIAPLSMANDEIDI